MPEQLPKITVVTPSYNQAQFLEQTILSVIGQEYPNLEYILMDGGSKDGSVEIIKKYEQHFTYWQSEKDNGQGAAINAGFAKATGDILCWLNSDDLFMPGTLLKIGRMFQNISEPTVIFGNCLHFHENSAKTRGSDVELCHKILELEMVDYMIQPSSFWTKSTWEKAGIIDEAYTFAFDWDWFIKVKRAGVKFVPIKDYLSLYRIHEAHKSGSGGNKRALELAQVYKTYKSEKIGNAFLKLDSLSTKHKLFHNAVYASNHYNLTFIRRMIHMVFFSSITFEEFSQMAPR